MRPATGYCEHFENGIKNFNIKVGASLWQIPHR